MMQKLRDIGIRIEGPSGPTAYGNAVPVLHEVLHALRRLQQTQETTIIDLHSLPFGPGDERHLLDTLGRGEVTVQLHAMGVSEIWETDYPGVWILDHKNPEGEVIALQIQVTRIPEILETPMEDLTASIDRLDGQLKAAATNAAYQDLGGRNG